ncbi:MAG: CAP domain-containing protein [Peptococcaceae bacterium]
MTSAQWEDLKNYYKDKEKPADYPFKETPDVVPSGIPAKSLANAALPNLYNKMQHEKAQIAIEEGEANLSAEEQKMVDLVNAERRKAGVPELKVSPKLCEAAKIRAKEANIKYSHTRPDGTSCDTVLEDVGLDMKLLDGNQLLTYSGNLAGSYKKNPMSAQVAFERFMNSASHKNNILAESNTYIGVAINYNGKQSSWIQSFCRFQY